MAYGLTEGRTERKTNGVAQSRRILEACSLFHTPTVALLGNQHAQSPAVSVVVPGRPRRRSISSGEGSLTFQASFNQTNSRMTVEASWVHMSHAQLFGKQNPGMDNLGLRLSVQLP